MKRLLPLLWGLSISAGALWIRVQRPQDGSPLLTALIGSEVVHVIAHTLLYGTLTLLALRAHGGRRARALVTVLGLGLIQELVQVTGVREFGRPELFDLGVDASAAGLAMGLSGLVGAYGRRGGPSGTGEATRPMR